MAEAIPYSTGQELLAYVLRKTGEVLPTADITSPQIAKSDWLLDAKRYIDQAQLDIVGLRPWSWARTNRQFAVPYVVPVQVASIQGTLVMLSKPPAATFAFEWFSFPDEGTQYNILSGAGTSWTLAIPYQGRHTSGKADMWQSTVALPSDYLGYPWIFNTDQDEWVPLRPLTDQGATVPRGGWEQHVRFWQRDRLLVLPRSSERRTIMVSFNRDPGPLSFDGIASTDTPLIPTQFRNILGDRAAERLYTDKRDPRSQTAAAEVRDTLSRMIGQEVAQSRPRLWIPRGHRIAG
jgi:hypothetical protein